MSSLFTRCRPHLRMNKCYPEIEFQMLDLANLDVIAGSNIFVFGRAGDRLSVSWPQPV